MDRAYTGSSMDRREALARHHHWRQLHSDRRCDHPDLVPETDPSQSAFTGDVVCTTCFEVFTPGEVARLGLGGRIR